MHISPSSDAYIIINDSACLVYHHGSVHEHKLLLLLVILFLLRRGAPLYIPRENFEGFFSIIMNYLMWSLLQLFQVVCYVSVSYLLTVLFLSPYWLESTGISRLRDISGTNLHVAFICIDNICNQFVSVLRNEQECL